MNKDTLKKLIKPPYIFILIGVVILAIFLKNKNSESGEIEETSTSGGNYDIFSAMETMDSANDVLKNLIDMNQENISVLTEKLDTNIIQLSDLIRTTDTKLTEGLDDLKHDLDDRQTTSITSKTTSNNSTKSKSKTVTVGTWGKDPISKTTLSGIAKDAGISLTTLLNLNPQYKSNPNLIHPGDKVKVS